MEAKRTTLAALLLLTVGAGAQTAKPLVCRTEVIEGEVNQGQPFVQAIGNGLRLLLQPTHSGWILRVVPATTSLQGVWKPDFRDYAMLATPPYQSVTPLSLSTDFAFRAQDAIGWNPRRFRFATSASSFARLDAAFSQLPGNGVGASPAVQSALAAEIGQASEGVLHILDARLAPGTADQWRMAAAVSSNFSQTAHALAPPTGGSATPLGEILWVRFRVELELPRTFAPAVGVKIVPHVCGSR